MGKAKVWLVITILIGIVTSLMVRDYLQGIKTSAESQIMSSVVQAVYNIPKGARVTEQMVKVIEVAANSVPAQAATIPVQVVGLIATSEIKQAELITTNVLVSEKTVNELPFKIPAGFRAITVAVDPLKGVAGLVKPGDYVDVLMTYSTSDNIFDHKVLTLLQNSLVLAVGQDIQKKEGGLTAENMTLAVTPHEAQLVMLSETVGRMKMVMRPATDTQKTDIKTIDLKTIQTTYP